MDNPKNNEQKHNILFQRFEFFSLKAKLIISMVGISLLTLTAALILTNELTTRSISSQSTENLISITESKASQFSHFLTGQIDALKTLALDDTLVNSVQSANASYQGTNDEIRSEISSLDHKWRGINILKGITDPFLQDRLNNLAAKKLREFNNLFPNHVELLLTDRYGALVGAYTYVPADQTRIGFPSDYDQADEEWWQSAYNNGLGNIHLDVPQYDESAGITSMTITVPVFQKYSGILIGILRTTLSVNNVASHLMSTVEESIFYDLNFPGKKPIQLHNGEIKTIEPFIYQELQSINNGTYKKIIFQDGKKTFVSRASIVSGLPAIDKLGWFITANQSEEYILQPVQSQQKLFSVVIIIISLLVAGIANFIARYLTTPVTQLTAIAKQVAEGNLSAKAQVQSKDEIGILAQAFNMMTEELHQSMSSLEQRVLERTRAIEAAAIVSRKISTILEPHDLINAVIQQLQQTFHYYHAHIYLFDNPKENLIVFGGTGEAGANMLKKGHKIPRGKGLVGRAAQTGTVVWVPDISKDEGWLPNPLLPDTKSEIAVPITIGDDVLGVIDIQQDIVNGISQQDADLVLLIANQTAVALRNARLYELAQHRAEREKQISSIVEQIQSTNSIEQALKVATREVGRVLNAPVQVSINADIS